MGNFNFITQSEIDFFKDYYYLHCKLNQPTKNFENYKEDCFITLFINIISKNSKIKTKEELSIFLKNKLSKQSYNFNWILTIIGSEYSNIRNNILIIFDTLVDWILKKDKKFYYITLKNNLINNGYLIVQSFIRMINIAFLFKTNKLTKETEDKILDKIWFNPKNDKLLKTKEDIKNFGSVANKRVLFNLFKNKKLFSFIKK
ncbi:hypothetical protein MSROBK_013390 [Spiroplasma poulsonii]|uniref:Uncharacterized protein n=1 Tax=Spiroplasma poulsonii TaxID=2138 RepID=A0A2P6FDE2_9MOLU|nr:hypothetical protein MSROBK_013390 [Spiroplasma poulsonii]PQM31481.1 hypothetical protein SMSRO_SF013160 [Spiroplasma poulsonii]PWF96496.1 hypothetical protein SMSE_19430 [Spiroplasma poulsonii]PWF97072.1 hypothetical protein SMH99_18810 [Spiroplasma poulsonii]